MYHRGSSFGRPKLRSRVGTECTPSERDFRARARAEINPVTDAFRRRYFPAATAADWNDYRWQLRHRLTSMRDLSRVLVLSTAERAALADPQRAFAVGLTPYYASLIDTTDATTALRKTVLPQAAEFRRGAGERDDPLAEDTHSPVPGIVHRYPDRVLFLVTDYCPVYCRYCTRSRLVGGNAGFGMNRAQWLQAIAYIERTPVIRDVLISGGDPLVYTDDMLDWLLSRLRPIPHVEIIRIGTKIPVALPQRITPGLAAMLRRHHPLHISLHVNHPAEITAEASSACRRLADAGIPLWSQTVLLRGVNDDIEIIRALMHALLTIRVRPYYLLQCDPITGSQHFRTPVAKGIEIIRGLRGHTSGYAVPQFIVDLPEGGGKVSLVPDYCTGRSGDDLVFRNYEGVDGYRYPDPGGADPGLM